jgi:hypothetical protein
MSMSKLEPFSLSMLGGSMERRFNRLRDKVELPWGTLAETKLPDELRTEAQAAWTRITYIEYRSAASMNAVADTMIAARAPLDLTAVASSFAADELSHAEMGARVVAELGGPEPMLTNAYDLTYKRPSARLAPLLRTAEVVVRVFCVAEAFALPMAQLNANLHAELPLINAVLRRIAKDEAAHASFGWTFMDWANQFFTDRQRAHLAKAAQEAIDVYRQLVEGRGDEESATLGWLSDRDFKMYGKQTLENDVCEPLRMRGIDVN